MKGGSLHVSEKLGFWYIQNVGILVNSDWVGVDELLELGTCVTNLGYGASFVDTNKARNSDHINNGFCIIIGNHWFVFFYTPAPPKVVEWGYTGFTPMPVRLSVRLSVNNVLKKLLAQFISYLAFTLMGWVSRPLYMFVFLASFSALWCPNIWPKMGFPELF